jgi:hypothetical protein
MGTPPPCTSVVQAAAADLAVVPLTLECPFPSSCCSPTLDALRRPGSPSMKTGYQRVAEALGVR